jgi:hypothetical protein
VDRSPARSSPSPACNEGECGPAPSWLSMHPKLTIATPQNDAGPRVGLHDESRRHIDTRLVHLLDRLPDEHHHFQFCPADHDDHYQQLYHDYASTLVLLVEHDYYYNYDDPFVVQYQ